MFVCEKRVNGYTELYLVETVREDGPRSREQRACQAELKQCGADFGVFSRVSP